MVEGRKIFDRTSGLSAREREFCQQMCIFITDYNMKEKVGTVSGEQSGSKDPGVKTKKRLYEKIRVAIVGSRGFDDYHLMEKEFKEFLGVNGWVDRNIIIVSGGAKGADTLAETLADEMGYDKKIFRADWTDIKSPGAVVRQGRYGQYNARAGLDRNVTMAEYSNAVLAFWDGKSKGTSHMVSQAKKFNKIVRVVKYEDS